MKMANGLLVPKRLGQESLQLVAKLVIIDRSLKVISADDHIIIPLTRSLSDEEVECLKTNLHDIHFLM
jgi:hypothetical protein